jgi:hypothetical protein
VKEGIEENFDASMKQVEPTLQSSVQVGADTSEALADATQRTAGLVFEREWGNCTKGAGNECAGRR